MRNLASHLRDASRGVIVDNDNPIDRVITIAKTKSDLHRAIDALPDDATLLLVANACCCGDPDHRPATGSAVYRAAFGSPTLPEALGLLRLAEHSLIAETIGGA
jgi:hypothetical protein